MTPASGDAQPKFAIRAADHGDTEWCADLMAAGEPWITLGRDRPAALTALTRPGSELFLARGPQAERLGFILLAAYGLAGSPYIASVATHPEMRSGGVGSALLDFAEERYRDRGHLFLLVSSFNTRAQALYLRRGFRQVGEIPDYIVAGHSELILHKRLA